MRQPQLESALVRAIRVYPRYLQFALLCLTLMSASLAGQRASAPQDSALDARTRSLASELRCPVCQGLSIQDSPSELAQQMRDLVQQQLRDGKSDNEIKQYFVGRYGQWILMEPPAAGFNWLVYALPAIALLGGALMLVNLLRRWTANPDAPATTPDSSPAPR